MPLLYYAVAFLGGYLVGRFTRRSVPQSAEAMMGGVAKLAEAGALDQIGVLEVNGGSDVDGVQIKIRTRETTGARDRGTNVVPLVAGRRRSW